MKLEHPDFKDQVAPVIVPVPVHEAPEVPAEAAATDVSAPVGVHNSAHKTAEAARAGLDASRARLNSAIAALGDNSELCKLRDDLEAAGRTREAARAALQDARERAAKFGYQEPTRLNAQRGNTLATKAGIALFTAVAERNAEAANGAASEAFTTLQEAIATTLADDVAACEAAEKAYTKAREAEFAESTRPITLREAGLSSRGRRRY